MLDFIKTLFAALILVVKISGLNDPPSVDNLTSTSSPAGHVASRHLENGGHFKNGLRRSAEKEGGYCAFPGLTWSTGTDSGDAHHVRDPGFSDVRLNRSDTFATFAKQQQQQQQQKHQQQQQKQQNQQQQQETQQQQQQQQQRRQQDYKIWISKTAYDGTFSNWTRRRVVKVMRTEMLVRDLMRASCSDDLESDEPSWNFEFHSKTEGAMGSDSGEKKPKESPLETWKSRLRSKLARNETERVKVKRSEDDDDDYDDDDDDDDDELLLSLPVNDGPLPCHKQEVKHHVMCLTEEPGDKYRVRIFYSGKALFSCVKFVSKASGIIQVYQAVPNVLNEDKLCHDSALQRDEWPWISLEQNRLQVNFPHGRTPAGLRSTSESTDYFHSDHHHHHQHQHHHQHHEQHSHHYQQRHHHPSDAPSPSSLLSSSASSPFPSHAVPRLDLPTGYNHHYHHHHHHHHHHRYRHRHRGSQSGLNRCSGFGGFEFQMHSTDVKQCESFQSSRGSYVEGECVEGDGVRFEFPDKMCSPFRGDSSEINFSCLNQWTDETFSFFLLALETSSLPRYIMRLPESSRTENRSFLGTFYFNLVTPLSGQGDPPGRGTFFQMHAARRPASRNCYDELTDCASLSATRGCYGNQEADDTLRMSDNCAKTCNLCDLPPLARSSRSCQFPIDLQGKWASYDKTQDPIEMFVSTGEIRSPSLGVMVCLGRTATLFAVGTFFNNGCKPRTCCLRFEVLQLELRFKLFGCQRHEPGIQDDAKSFCHDADDADDVVAFSSLKRRSLLPKNFKTIKCGFQTTSEVAFTTSGGNTCHGIMSDLDNSTCSGAQALTFYTWKCPHLAEFFEYQCVDYVVQSYVLRILVTYSTHEQKQSCWSIKSKEFALQNDANKRHDLKFQLRKINCTSAETIIRSNSNDEIFSIDVFRDREFTTDSCSRALDKNADPTSSGSAYPPITDQRDSRSSDHVVRQMPSGPYHNHHHHKPQQDDDRLHGLKTSRGGSDGLDDRGVGSRFCGGVPSGVLVLPVIFLMLTFSKIER